MSAFLEGAHTHGRLISLARLKQTEGAAEPWKKMDEMLVYAEVTRASCTLVFLGKKNKTW